jgi:hypothetical protein
VTSHVIRVTIAAVKRDADALIERLRKIALALPDAYEKLSHGEPTFFNKGGSFAMVDNGHHGSGHVAVWCNASPGAQESLTDGDPRHFFVPPYVGKAGWVGIRLDSGLPWPVIADLVAQAHAATDARRKRRRSR